MTAPTIAVEDIALEPEGSRVEPAASEPSTEHKQEVGAEVSQLEELQGEPPEETSIQEPTAAGPATVKVRCPKCEKELLPKTFKYSHYCDGKQHRPSGAQLLDKSPGLEPLEPTPKPAPRAKSPRKKRFVVKPPPTETSSSDVSSSPPPRHRLPTSNHRHTHPT